MSIDSDHQCTEHNSQQSGANSTRLGTKRTALGSSSPSRSSPSMVDRTKRRRTSAFKEIGLDEDYDDTSAFVLSQEMRHGHAKGHRRRLEIHDAVVSEKLESAMDRDSKYRSTYKRGSQQLTTSGSASTRTILPSMSRFYVVAFLLAIALPLLHNSPLVGRSGNGIIGVQGGVIKKSAAQERAIMDGELVGRANSPTDVCKRWSHQSKDLPQLSARCDSNTS